MSFGYDANGRMVKAARENQPDALSVYDSLGNRVATKFNDVWQFVIYDAFGKLIAEYGGMQSSDEGGVRYILSDWQGSVRAILNNAGFIQSRTDYTSFGEEINAGVGLRTQSQGFGVSNQTRQGYGLTEKDETGLNHTWFRKNENRAGRWTSPDPYNGSINLGNPQSFNRYSYVENEPTNFIDPSGLLILRCITTYSWRWNPNAPVYGDDGNPTGQFGDYELFVDERCYLIDIGGSPSIPVPTRNQEISGGFMSAINNASISNNMCGLGLSGLSEGKPNPNIWQGRNGKLYDIRNNPRFYGNRYTGSRNQALMRTNSNIRLSNVVRTAGRISFGVGAGISVIQGAQALSDEDYAGAGKAGLDVIMSGIGTFGGPKGLIIAGVYFGDDASIGWGNVANFADAIRNSRSNCAREMLTNRLGPRYR